jgi:hypothetical protein
MANRTPREKLPPEQKSRTYSIRLDPKNIDDAWVIDAIEFYAKQEVDLKTLFKELLAGAEGKPVGDVRIKARDIADMIRTIRELKEMLEGGAVTVGGTGAGKPKARRAKQKEIEYSDTMRSTFDKFVNRGFSAADFEDEDDE